MSVLEKLSDEECYLWAILSDPSGLDQAEFLWTDAEHLEETKELDQEGNVLLDSEGKPRTKNTYCFQLRPPLRGHFPQLLHQTLQPLRLQSHLQLYLLPYHSPPLLFFRLYR